MNKEELERLIEVEQRSSRNERRIDEHDCQLKELANVYIALTKVDNKVTNVETDVTEMKQDIKDIKETPKKRYDTIITVVITAIISGLIAFLFAYLGMK